jgi:hypothetical protein
VIFKPGQDEELKAWTFARHKTGIVLIQVPGGGFRRHFARCTHIFY